MHLKQQIAAQAAQIMHELRLQDYGLAKRKALTTLGLPENTALPENRLINQALSAHLRLFASAADKQWQQDLKQAAIHACDFLDDFRVYIGGSLASGCAKADDRLEVLLYHDDTESLLWKLQDHQIPYQEQERVMHCGRHTEAAFPCFSFVANNVPVSITVLPNSKPQSKPCDVDGKALPRLKPTQLEAL